MFYGKLKPLRILNECGVGYVMFCSKLKVLLLNKINLSLYFTLQSN